MKRILAILMIAVMLVSIFAVSVAADEPVIIIDEDFSNEELFMQRFGAGKFFVEGGILVGYTEAKALQTNHELHSYNTYDMEFTFAMAEDDMNIGDRYVVMAYPNSNMVEHGIAEKGWYFNFGYDIENGELTFVAGEGVQSTDENDIHLMDPVPMELDVTGETFYTMGMSIDRGRIRCFFEGELIYDFVDTQNQYAIAATTLEPFLVWNEYNCLMINHIKIGQVGSIYPYATETETTVTTEPAPTETTTQGSDEPIPTETTTVGDDEPAPTETTTADTTQIVEVTELDTDGNVVVKTEIITNAPAPDTVGTTGSVGTSTSTGDATLVVVIAMVAAIGSALIVKKACD